MGLPRTFVGFSSTDIHYYRLMQANTCPPIIRDIGAIFAPFSPKIIAHAIKDYSMPNDHGNYYYNESEYEGLGLRMKSNI